jgi:hypothetical protein
VTPKVLNAAIDEETGLQREFEGILYYHILEGVPAADGMSRNMGVWQGVAMDSLKFYPGLLGPALLSPAGEPPWGGLPAGKPAGLQLCFNPLDTPRRSPMRGPWDPQ